MKTKDFFNRIDSKEIFQKMSPELRQKVEMAAKEQGVSAEDFISKQLAAQLMEGDLSLDVSETETGGAEVRVRTDVRAGPGQPVQISAGPELRIPIRIGRRRR